MSKNKSYRVIVFIMLSLSCFLFTIVEAKVPKGKRPTITKAQTYKNKKAFSPLFSGFEKETVLWYQFPAKNWIEALPIGNGRFGAMIFGGVSKDVIQFNHENLWTPTIMSDELIAGKLPNKEAYVDKMRKLIFAGKPFEAHDLFKHHKIIEPHDSSEYQPFAELNFDYDFDTDKAGNIQDYCRNLDMETGVAATSFKTDGTTYVREIFVDKDLDVIAIRMKAVGPGKISTQISLSRPAWYDYQKAEIASLGNNGISISGTAHGLKKVSYSTSYEAVVKVFIKSGSLNSKNGIVTVKDASEMLLVLTGATNYNIKNPYKPLDLDLHKKCLNLSDSFTKKGWGFNKNKAVKYHQAAFNRFNIHLGKEKNSAMPTDKRIIKEQHAPLGQADGLLASQMVQFARYMTICCSRPGTLPIQLTGIWNPRLGPAWKADYHHNINTQMSYWPTEVLNLSEFHTPYFDIMQNFMRTGKKAASEMFGCRGIRIPIMHGTYWSAIPRKPPRGFWNMAGAWISMHIMEHYRFGGDKDYLRQVGLPLLRENVLFCLDWLVEDPKTGQFVVGPDVSAENTYLLKEEDRAKKRWCQEDMGTTMSQQLVWQLFSDYLEAIDVLYYSADKNLVSEVKAKLARLASTKINSENRIMEWSKDFVEGAPQHRHVSHLIAFYPGAQFNKKNATKMVKAAKNSIKRRGEGNHGFGKVAWSIPWCSLFYARFGEAELAFKVLANTHKNKTINVNMMGSQGKVLDSCFGYSAAIAEMLLQSHEGEINLLPALPKAWQEGDVNGLVARGGFEISMKWKNGKLTDATILSKHGNPCVVCYKDTKVSLNLKKDEKLNLKKALSL